MSFRNYFLHCVYLEVKSVNSWLLSQWELSVKLSDQQSLPFKNWNSFSSYFCLLFSIQFHQKAKPSINFEMTELVLCDWVELSAFAESSSNQNHNLRQNGQQILALWIHLNSKLCHTYTIITCLFILTSINYKLPILGLKFEGFQILLSKLVLNQYSLYLSNQLLLTLLQETQWRK